MKHRNNWFLKLLNDHDGEPSSKRLIGVLSALALIYCLIFNSIYPANKPAEYLVDAIGLLTFGCLGLTSTEKIFSIVKSSKISPEKNKEEKKEEKKSDKKEEKPKTPAPAPANGNDNTGADADAENGSEVQ